MSRACRKRYACTVRVAQHRELPHEACRGQQLPQPPLLHLQQDKGDICPRACPSSLLSWRGLMSKGAGGPAYAHRRAGCGR
jgi:hypothetical protein